MAHWLTPRPAWEKPHPPHASASMALPRAQPPRPAAAQTPVHRAFCPVSVPRPQPARDPEHSAETPKSPQSPQSPPGPSAALAPRQQSPDPAQPLQQEDRPHLPVKSLVGAACDGQISWGEARAQEKRNEPKVCPRSPPSVKRVIHKPDWVEKWTSAKVRKSATPKHRPTEKPKHLPTSPTENRTPNTEPSLRDRPQPKLISNSSHATSHTSPRPAPHPSPTPVPPSASVRALFGSALNERMHRELSPHS